MNNLVFAIFLCTVPLMGQPISFRANQVTNLPTNENQIASFLSGDFNNDGKLDVVAVLNNEILFYPGTGGELFGAPIATPLSPLPYYDVGVAGDFNGDGYLDLVLFEQFDGSNVFQVVTMLGNGTGTFQTFAIAPTLRTPAYPITADFNRDGIPDIAWVDLAGGAGPASIEVQFGLGNGAFEEPRTFPLAAHVWALTDGDFNGDGQIDLALIEGPVGQPGTVHVLFGNGKGSFAKEEIVPLNLGSTLGSIAAGHLNADLYLDLVVSTETGFAVLLGTGNGRFEAPRLYPAGTGGPVFIADINGDGNRDILFANSAYLNGVVYALGKGDGTFGPSVPTYQSAGSIATGDFNQDGITDVAAILQNSGQDNQISVLTGSHTGLVVAPTLSLAASIFSGPVTADFNRDGKPDIAVVTESGIAVYLGDGHGNWTSTALLPGIPSGITIGDFNGDGIPDIADATANSVFGPGIIDVYLGKGDGTFSSSISSPGPPEPGGPVTGDFNGDGKLDIVFSSNQGYSPLSKGAVAVLLGNGNGTFSKATYYIGDDFPNGLAVADFNGDGIPDIAFDNYYSRVISLLTGKGDGTFLPPVAIATASNGPEQIQAVDVNRDGRPDLVVGAGTVNVYLNQGNGAFKLSATNAPFGIGVVVADLNGDGIPDLASDGLTGVSIQQGNGDGTFQAPILYGMFNRGPMIVGHFYGHTLPDIAMTSEGGVAFLVNTTSTGTSGESTAKH